MISQATASSNAVRVVMEFNQDSVALDLEVIADELGVKSTVWAGVYKGTHNPSYGFSITHKSELKRFMYLGRKYNQESILVLDSDNNGSLVFCSTGEVLELGQWQQVAPALTASMLAYTSINGTPYACL
jgi:hypothetical protein